MIKRIFRIKWLLLAILVVVAIAVTIRLGIWQLDRLEQRRVFNARVTAQITQPALELGLETITADLRDMEYREVVVSGVYDHDQEIALRNQHWQNQWGVHLVTPLLIEGSKMAVLVDRGWIPAEEFNTWDWSKYTEPGVVEVKGVIRASKNRADFGSRNDEASGMDEERIKAWNFVKIDRISEQTSLELLPVYIQQAPDNTHTAMPYRTQPELDLTEGPHQSYAIQWFSFAVIIALGFPLLVYTREFKRGRGNNTRRMNKTEVHRDQSIAS